jgi:hypothetical protein
MDDVSVFRDGTFLLLRWYEKNKLHIIFNDVDCF